MKTILLGLTGALLVSASALAQQTANVVQSGPSNAATIEQVSNTAATAIVDQSGVSDIAALTQSGNGAGTSALITQSGGGAGNASARIDQFDNASTTASIDQINGGFAEIFQDGQTGSAAIVSQTNANSASILQNQGVLGAGFNNTATITQTGGDITPNVASLIQGGDNNSFSATQSGDGNTIGFFGGPATQTGDGNIGIVAQSNTDNTANLFQAGAFNTFSVDQSGTGGTVSVTQSN